MAVAAVDLRSHPTEESEAVGAVVVVVHQRVLHLRKGSLPHLVVVLLLALMRDPLCVCVVMRRSVKKRREE